MSTLKQIEANRSNALKSTGPRTPQGKTVSRMNALHTGIDAASHVIPGEDPAAFQALVTDYYEHWEPTAPQHRALVEILISNDWLLRRLRKVEAQLWSDIWNRYSEKNLLKLDAPLADVYNGLHKILARVQARINSLERNYHRALRELSRLQPPPHADPPRAPAPARTPQPIDSKPAPPRNGFVPQTSSDVPQPAPQPVPVHTESPVVIASPPPATLE